MYVTVNRRDNAKVLRGLQHYLLDHHWLFDFHDSEILAIRQSILEEAGL